MTGEALMVAAILAVLPPGTMQRQVAPEHALVDPRRDGKDVGIEDDVVRVGAVGDEQFVCALADRDFTLGGVGLANLVESHDHDRGAISAAFARKLKEWPLAFLHADRIDDRLALHALEACHEHRPLRAVDHHGHAGDFRLSADVVEEVGHRPLGVEHALVHVDVDEVGAVRDLLTRDRAKLDLRNASDVDRFFAQEKPAVVILAAAKVGNTRLIDNMPV
jgi:hypothetical protein